MGGGYRILRVEDAVPESSVYKLLRVEDIKESTGAELDRLAAGRPPATAPAFGSLPLKPAESLLGPPPAGTPSPEDRKRAEIEQAARDITASPPPAPSPPIDPFLSFKPPSTAGQFGKERGVSPGREVIERIEGDQARAAVSPVITGPGEMVPLGDADAETLRNAVTRTALGVLSAEGLATILAGGFAGQALKAAANTPRLAAALKNFPAVSKAIDIASRAAVPATFSGMGVRGAAQEGMAAMETDDRREQISHATSALTNLLFAGLGATGAVRAARGASAAHPKGATDQFRSSRGPARHSEAEAAARETAQQLSSRGERLAATQWAEKAKQLSTDKWARVFGEEVPVEFRGKPATIKFTGADARGRPALSLVDDATGRVIFSGRGRAMQEYLRSSDVKPKAAEPAATDKPAAEPAAQVEVSPARPTAGIRSLLPKETLAEAAARPPVSIKAPVEAPITPAEIRRQLAEAEKAVQELRSAAETIDAFEEGRQVDATSAMEQVRQFLGEWDETDASPERAIELAESERDELRFMLEQVPPEEAETAEEAPEEPGDPTPGYTVVKEETAEPVEPGLTSSISAEKVDTETPERFETAAAPGRAEGSSTKPDQSDMILDAMKPFDPAQKGNTYASIPRVRKSLGLSKEEFDAAALKLYGDHKVLLGKHDFPDSLKPEELADLVHDGKGNYYIGIAYRDAGPVRPIGRPVVLGAGLGPLQALFERKDHKPDTPKFAVQDTEVASRIEAAMKPIEEPPGAWQKVADGARRLKDSFARNYEHLPRGERYGPLIFRLDQLKKAKGIAMHDAADGIIEAVGKFDAHQFGLFTQKVALDDLIARIEQSEKRGVAVTPEDLPFGFKSVQQVRDERVRATSAADADPKIQNSLTLRRQLQDEIKSAYIGAMKKSGHPKDMERILGREDYFRHRVLEYMDIKLADQGTGAAVRIPTGRSWLKRAEVNANDYSLDYLQSEFEVLQQMLYDTVRAETVAWIKNPRNKMNILPELRARARAENKETGAGPGNKEWVNPRSAEALVREYVPRTHGVWQPDKGNIFFMGDTISERLAKQILEAAGEEIGVKAEDLRKALVYGGRKEETVLPNEVIATINEFSQKLDTGIESWLSRGSQSLIRLWKQYTLVAPHRVFKYNFRNLTGDAEASFVGNPRAFQRIPEASRELWRYFKHGEMTEGLRDWFDRGGLQSLLQVQEIGDINRIEQMERLMHPEMKKPNALKRAWSGTWAFNQKWTNFRESILRYSNFMEYMEQMKANPEGRPRNFGGSIREEVMGLDDIKDRAYKLSNDLLGAYDEISAAGQHVRRKLIPFWSFQEINMRRYWRLAKNAYLDGQLMGSIGRKVAGKALNPWTAYRIGQFAFAALAFKVGLEVWNRTMFPEESKGLSEQARRNTHIILGRRKDGSIIYFSRVGILDDFLEWFGLESGHQHVKDYLNNRRGFREIAKDMSTSSLEKVVFSLTPTFKIPAEQLLGSTLFPWGRPIRDRWEHVFKQLDMEGAYRRVMNKPTRPWDAAQVALKWLAYEADPNRNSYYEIKDEVRRFNESKGLGGSAGGKMGARSEALYNIKLAIRFEDKKALEKYLGDYFAMGGRPSNVRQSIRGLHPLNSLRKRDRREFDATLDAEQRQQLERATEYWKSELSGDITEIRDSMRRVREKARTGAK